MSLESPAAGAHGGDLEGYEADERCVVGGDHFRDEGGCGRRVSGAGDTATVDSEVMCEVRSEGSPWWWPECSWDLRVYRPYEDGMREEVGVASIEGDVRLDRDRLVAAKTSCGRSRVADNYG